MISFQKTSIFRTLLLLVFSLSANITFGQESSKTTSEGVFEIRNFTEEKMLPELNKYLSEKEGVYINSYCLGQNLIGITFEMKSFPTGEMLMYFLEEKGYVAYLKYDMSISQIDQECKSSVVKVKSN